MKVTIIKLLLAALFVLTCGTSVAYNVLYTNIGGNPVKWDNTRPIRYYLDPGPYMGLTNDQAKILLQEAMKLWENVPHSKVPKFEFAGYLPEDVTIDNYYKYFDNNTCVSENMEYCENPEIHQNLQTVIIFDDNDDILRDFLCLSGCGGAAYAMTFDGGYLSDLNYIIQGVAAFSRPMMPANNSPSAVIVAHFVHELGHLLGLAHTPINQQLFYQSGAGLDDEDILFLPTMEASPGTGVYSSSYATGATLNPDDMAGISKLYPSDDFAQKTSAIKGVIKKSDHAPMPMLNVIARNVTDPLCKAYSFISSRYCTHEGGTFGWVCLQGPDGNYSIEGLPQGDYTVEVEEIIDVEDASAALIHNGQIAGDAEFWNENDQANEDPYLYTIIHLEPGDVRENVDIILNRSEVTEDRVKFIPLDVILANFPLPETSACTDNTVDYASLIGVDEGGDDSNASPGGGCALIPRN